MDNIIGTHDNMDYAPPQLQSCASKIITGLYNVLADKVSTAVQHYEVNKDSIIFLYIVIDCIKLSAVSIIQPTPCTFTKVTGTIVNLNRNGNIFGSAMKESFCVLVTSGCYYMEGHMERLGGK